MALLMPLVVLFSAAGVNAIAHRLGARMPIGFVRVGLALALIAAFSAESFALPLQLMRHWRGSQTSHRFASYLCACDFP